jgi:hypothetical protein
MRFPTLNQGGFPGSEAVVDPPMQPCVLVRKVTPATAGEKPQHEAPHTA